MADERAMDEVSAPGSIQGRHPICCATGLSPRPNWEAEPAKPTPFCQGMGRAVNWAKMPIARQIIRYQIIILSPFIWDRRIWRAQRNPATDGAFAGGAIQRQDSEDAELNPRR